MIGKNQGWEPLSQAMTQKIRRIHSVKGREKLGLFMAEGFRALSAALIAHWPIEAIVVEEVPEITDRVSRLLAASGMTNIRLYTCSSREFKELTATVEPAGVIAVLNAGDNPPLDLEQLPDHLLVLDNLRDPGNVGAVLRSAAAFGIEGVVLPSGTVDAYNPKVVRAAAGAHFVVPLYERCDRNLLVRALQEQQAAIYVADPHEGENIRMIEIPSQWALVIGGETEGYAAIWQECGAQAVRIPMEPEIESLNAAVAAGILLSILCGDRFF